MTPTNVIRLYVQHWQDENVMYNCHEEDNYFVKLNPWYFDDIHTVINLYRMVVLYTATVNN